MKFLAVKEREEGAAEAENCEDPLAKGNLGTEKRRLLLCPDKTRKTSWKR